MDLTVACVRVGNKYSFDYVTRLRSMVARNLPLPHRFVCLTDIPFTHPEIGCVLINEYNLPGWWSKMCLFRNEWRRGKTVLYLDLDTVVINDITALTSLDPGFYICENFTRAADKNWPCKYGSCVMVMTPGSVSDVWDRFWADRSATMTFCGRFGDQLAIEKLEPNAGLLQHCLPGGFFLGRRQLIHHKKRPPAGASMIIFAGPSKPHNCGVDWVLDAWKED